MAKKDLKFTAVSDSGGAETVKQERAGKKNLPSLPAHKTTQPASEAPAIVKAVVQRLHGRPSKEASAAFDSYVKPDHTVAILTGRKAVAQQQADAAQREYEAYAASNPIPRLPGNGYAANPAAGGELDTESEQYRQAQLLRQKAQEASREAQNAADRLTYEQDMRRINALPDAVRAALHAYTEGRPNVLNPSEYSAGVRIQSRKKLKEAGLSGDEIDALSETYARYLNQVEAQKAAQLAKQHTDDGIGGTLWGNALSVGGNLVSGITGTADVLMEGAGRLLNPDDRYHNLDPNLPGFLPSVYSGTVRQETTQNIEGNPSDSPLRQGAGKFGSMLYQAAMSGMDNLARAATGAGGALALAGTSSFQNAVRETTLKGGTPQQAYAMGVAQAGLEILTEKVSIDKLFSTPTPENVTQLLKNAAVQGAVEMTEEEMNFAGGLIADALIMGKNSDYNRDIQELVSGGMSYEQAKKQATHNVLYQALETAAQSFLSGSVTSGTRGAFEHMVSKSQTAQDSADFAPEEQAPTAEEMAAELPEGFATEEDIKAVPDVQPVDKLESLKRDIRATFAALSARRNGEAAATEKGSVTTPESVQADSVMPEPDAVETLADNAPQQPLVNEGENTETESVGAAPQGFDPYSNLQYQYGNQPDRANDARAVNVPKKDTYGRTVSEFAANAYGAEAIPDSFIPEIEQLIRDGAMGHDRRTNAESLRMAAAEIAKSEAAVRKSIEKAVLSGRIGDSDIAAAMLLVIQDANGGNMDSASELMVDLKEMATRSGRNLQLFKLLRRLTPEGQYMTVEKTVRRFVDDANKRRSKRKQVDVQIPQELIDDYLNAVRQESTAPQTPDAQPAAVTDTDSLINPDGNPTAEPRQTPSDVPSTPDTPAAPSVDEAEDAIYEFVASQIPATLQEKWDSWRYMAMLGNPKTQIRNMAGNLIFRPFVEAKRYLGAAAEAMVIKDRNQRTKAILGNSEADQALKAWADIDARRMAGSGRMDYTASTGDSAANTIEEKRTIFKNKALEAARTGLSDLMGAEDMIFKRWEYKTSLASFLKARGCTADQLMAGQVSESLLEEARSYAVQEAMKATFNDRNAVSDFVVGLRFKGHNPVSRAANAMMEGVLPFRRTPANIVVRAAEYSPANVVRGIANAATKVRSGEMTAADAVDQISSGLVGTGAMALGYALASGIFGVRLVGNEDDEDELRAGHQSYALEIGNQSYTIDWAAPACLPLFMGANLYASLNPDGEETSVSTLTAFLDTCANTFEPMLELSCLSSLNDLIQDTRYAEEGRELYTIAASMATNYLMQGLPTLFGQIEQTFEDRKKTVYSNNADPALRQLERTVGRATQKIPGIDLFQAERLDEWGEPEPQKNVFQKGAEAFISPGYHSEISTDPVESELSRLNKSQSENVSPSDAEKTLRFTDAAGNPQNVRFTPEQWEALQKAQGQTAHRVISDLISSEDYKLLSDTQKAAAIDAAHAYAREVARTAHVDGYTKMSAKWMEDIEGKEAAAILERTKVDASGLTSSQYSAALQQGMSLEQMQSVSEKVNRSLKLDGGTSKYDTYRAVLRTVPEAEQGAWLKIYGMSDSQLKAYDEAKGRISAEEYVNALELKSGFDAAFSATGADSEKKLQSAYHAYKRSSVLSRKYFETQNGGRIAAYIQARKSGVNTERFLDLYQHYRQIDSSDAAKSVKADNWAATLDKAVEQGKLTAPQRQTMWESLGYYSQVRQNAQKYHDLTAEGLSSDIALIVRNTLASLKPESGKSNVRPIQQYEAIVRSPNLTSDQRLAALYAYGDDDADQKLDEALELGLDAQRYVEAYRMYADASGKGKKARTIKHYQDAFGLDYSTAKTLYEIYA